MGCMLSFLVFTLCGQNKYEIMNSFQLKYTFHWKWCEFDFFFLQHLSMQLTSRQWVLFWRKLLSKMVFLDSIEASCQTLWKLFLQWALVMWFMSIWRQAWGCPNKKTFFCFCQNLHWNYWLSVIQSMSPVGFNSAVCFSSTGYVAMTQIIYAKHALLLIKCTGLSKAILYTVLVLYVKCNLNCDQKKII